MTDFTQTASNVRAEYNGLEYVRRIKQLVQDELRSIDSHAQIEDTHYFNHSAIPDFVVTWSNERGSRDVYLRASYASVVAAHDVRKSGGPGAMFLALDAQKEFDTEYPRIGSGDIAKEAGRSRSTLLTDVRAIDEISETTQGPEASPIAGLVRDNFVRAARGWIDEPRASTLVGATSEDAPRSSMSVIVRQSFDETAALRLERTAALMDAVLRPEDGQGPGAWQALTDGGGQLSPAELTNVLPWLLDNFDTHPTRPDFWGYFARLIDFRKLQLAAASIDGRDITPLVMASANKWSSKRAYLGLAIESSGAPAWKFRGGQLCLEVGDARITFSDDGRSLRGRDSHTSPRWDDIKLSLDVFRLASVSLRGITRSVRIDAGESDDIRLDVQRVVESLADSYNVTDVQVVFDNPTEDSNVTVEIDFGKSLALASPLASLTDLSHAAMSLLAYRTPVGGGRLESAFSGDEYPIESES